MIEVYLSMLTDEKQKTDFQIIYEEYKDLMYLCANRILAEVPVHSFSKSFERKMKKLFRKNKCYDFDRKSRVRKPIKYALITAAVIISMAATALREKVFNVIVTVTKKSTEYSYYSGRENIMPDSPIASVIDGLEIGWIPKGFYFDKETRYIDEYQYEFSSNNDDTIVISKSAGQAGTISIDTENAKVIDITINKFSATLSEKKDSEGKERVIIFWIDENNGICYLVITHGVGKNDTIKIADNIKDDDN